MGRRSRLDRIGRNLNLSKKDGSKRSMKDIAKLNKLGKLGEHVKPEKKKGVSNASDPGKRASGLPDDFVGIRQHMQATLSLEFDFEEHGGMGKEATSDVMRAHLAHLMDRSTFSVSRADRELMCQQIIDNLLGLGPLEPIINDPQVTDIMINGPRKTFIEKGGLLKQVACDFDSDKHLLAVIRRIITAVGRKVDEQNPMVDARMLDGSRFNAIISPCSLDGCAVSIRRFGVPIRAEQLVNWNAMPAQQMDFLDTAVKTKMNIVISGGTGSGKTTLLNCLSGFVPEGERIVTIEDSAELQLQQNHVVRLESRPANSEGTGEIHLGQLLKHSLRMRADRIILGEIRGAEAVDMLGAMNSGNPGSMATVHSNSPTDALSRFETMVAVGMPNMSSKFIRQIIASSLDLIVQLNRLADGSRRCTGIAEVTGMEGPYITIQDIYKFHQTDTLDGTIYGYYEPTGLRPRMLAKATQLGLPTKEEWFDFKLRVAGKKVVETDEELEPRKNLPDDDPRKIT
jgi:pilus assembly protein CpaF